MARSSRVPGFETGISQIEMRTETRYPLLQRCFVHPVKASVSLAWQCIAYNISATGIGVTLPARLQEGTVLTIQAWSLPRACPLQVRIVQTKLVELLWFTGCEMLKRLSDADLQNWRSGPLHWLDEHRQ